jgi:hypothetical protein
MHNKNYSLKLGYQNGTKDSTFVRAERVKFIAWQDGYSCVVYQENTDLVKTFSLEKYYVGSKDEIEGSVTWRTKRYNFYWDGYKKMTSVQFFANQ